MAYPLSAFKADIDAVIEAARTGQQIVDIIGSVNHVAADIAELSERRAELAPELAASLAGLQDAANALARAQDTAAAMTSVALENNTSDEGSPS